MQASSNITVEKDTEIPLTSGCGLFPISCLYTTPTVRLELTRKSIGIFSFPEDYYLSGAYNLRFYISNNILTDDGKFPDGIEGVDLKNMTIRGASLHDNVFCHTMFRLEDSDASRIFSKYADEGYTIHFVDLHGGDDLNSNLHLAIDDNLSITANEFIKLFNHAYGKLPGKNLLFLAACNENAREVDTRGINMPVVICTNINGGAKTRIKIYEPMSAADSNQQDPNVTIDMLLHSYALPGLEALKGLNISDIIRLLSIDQ